MKSEAMTEKMKRQRKFLLVLPLLALPFITIMFWLLDGGQGNKAVAAAKGPQGLQTELPSAIVRDRPMDKMRYYELAEKDLEKRKEQMRNDPYYAAAGNTSDSMESDHSESSATLYAATEGYSTTPAEKHEAVLVEKLQALEAAINAPVKEEKRTTQQSSAAVSVSAADRQAIEQLEQMMQQMQASPAGPDPEMEQLNGMLQTILDIQHPERVQERLKNLSEQRKGEVFAVNAVREKAQVTTLGHSAHDSLFKVFSQNGSNGFYSLDRQPEELPVPNAIQAVVHETQTLMDGATVKLRLVQDIFINGTRIPAGHFLFGTVSINGERLIVQIGHIRYGASLFPVSISVHDLDGMKGIYIPGAITREVVRQSGSGYVQSLGMTSLNPSLGAQAASAGIELGRNLLSKKIKRIKVEVKAGYKVLLLDEKKKEYRN